MERHRWLAGVLMGVLLPLGAAAGCGDKGETAAPAAAARQDEAPADQVAPEAAPQARSATARPRPALPDTDGATQSDGEERGGHGRGMRGERRAAMLDEFDKNGDGQIDDTERGAMLHVRAEQMIERHDTDGDGSLSGAELAAIQSGGRRRFMGNLSAADANGDGAVSADELAAHLATRAQQRRSGAGSAPGGAGQEQGAAQGEEGGQGGGQGEQGGQAGQAGPASELQ
jgi:hypothetical protein